VIETAPLAIGYDPVRDAIIGWSPDGFQQLVGSSWQPLPIGLSSPTSADAIVFDPIGKRLVAVGRPQVFGPAYTALLSPDNQLTTFNSPSFHAIAFDARNHEVIGTGYNGDSSRLVADDWAPSVGPGSIYVPVTNGRRGTVEFYAAGEKLVERIGTQWVEHASLAPIPITGSVVMNQSTGELHIIGIRGSSRFMMHRRWTSETPAEDCSPGTDTDLDGDGLHGCSDPDCWTVCTPACPPFVTCP
jgi:hypothetical protein